MRRTFNYTGRSRITQSMVKFRLRWNSESPSPTFIVDFDLDELDLEPNLKIYVDAARQDTLAFMRFDFGAVGAIVQPENTLLSEFNRQSKPKFFVKIVDESDSLGKIVADSRAILPVDPDEDKKENAGMTLIHVVEEDLEDQVWKLQMPTQDNEVVDLILNSRIDQVKAIFNEEWAAPLMLPNAVREILLHIAVVLKTEYDETGEQWYSLWLRFMMNYYDEILPQLVDEDSDDELEERRAWVENAVSAFSTKMNFKNILEVALWGGDGLENEA